MLRGNASDRKTWNITYVVWLRHVQNDALKAAIAHDQLGLGRFLRLNYGWITCISLLLNSWLQFRKYATQIGPGAVVYKLGFETDHVNINGVMTYREKEVLQGLEMKTLYEEGIVEYEIGKCCQAEAKRWLPNASCPSLWSWHVSRWGGREVW